MPVHPNDQLLLEMKWESKYYVDAVMPLGLRSAPRIYNALADALHWIVKHNGVRYPEHYLDDFIQAVSKL